MKIVVQRVSNANVTVDGKIVGSIGPGIVVFVGVTHDDTANEVVWLANKLVGLRIFEDAQGKMNQSLLECHGEALIISQFTLYADCSAGRRPSFTQAAQPEMAKQLYEQFLAEVQKGSIKVQSGIFAADMKVSLLNDGPVTLILERNRNTGNLNNGI